VAKRIRVESGLTESQRTSFFFSTLRGSLKIFMVSIAFEVLLVAGYLARVLSLDSFVALTIFVPGIIAGFGLPGILDPQRTIFDRDSIRMFRKGNLFDIPYSGVDVTRLDVKWGRGGYRHVQIRLNGQSTFITIAESYLGGIPKNRSGFDLYVWLTYKIWKSKEK
jgi:hypothetical protein